MQNENRVALVLGAVKGIGLEIAVDLARRGMRVALNYWDWEEARDAMEAAIKATGADYAIFHADLTDCRAAAEMVAAAVARFGRLDILVNNIERGGWPVVHGPYVPEQWDLEMRTTLRAKRWVFEAALPHLKDGGGGAVINFSSIAGLVGRSGPVGLIFNDGYAAANRAIALLTETWARMGAPLVRVNEIMLGIFETRHAQGTRGWELLSPQEQAAVINHTLLGRTGRLADILDAVRFLIDGASYMTGSVLRIDGGYVLGGEPVGPMPAGVL